MELLNNEIKIPFKFNLKCKCNCLAGLDWRYLLAASLYKDSEEATISR